MRKVLVAAVAATGFGACTAERTADVELLPETVRLTVEGGMILAPDTLSAGWTRLRFEEDGEGHILVVYRLPASADGVDAAAFGAALDTSSHSPLGASPIGGAEVGDTSEVVLELTPGRYVLACAVRGRDRHRHAATGEARLLVVRRAGSAGKAAPTATVELPMHDFAYAGPEEWPAGSHVVRVTNHGQQDHQVRFARLRDGITLRTWFDSSETMPTDSTVAGIARMAAGATGYFFVDVAAGRYVLYCLIPDPVSGQPHVALGMFREIRVLSP